MFVLRYCSHPLLIVACFQYLGVSTGRDSWTAEQLCVVLGYDKGATEETMHIPNLEMVHR